MGAGLEHWYSRIGDFGGAFWVHFEGWARMGSDVLVFGIVFGIGFWANLFKYVVKTVFRK